MLNLYTIFHLNLAYSSIEEHQRVEVIDRCYKPLLRLIKEQRIPIGIEASGYTLATIRELAPLWINELKALIKEGLCEFIGSGYAQIIGPLVPAEVNQWNQALGQSVYDKILGIRPVTAMVNEMAYSAGLVEHYLNNGYQSFFL